MFIAQEQQHTGRLAEALGNADRCQREADANPSLQDRAAILRTCTELQRTLRPMVGRVVVNVPTPAPEGLRVTVAGQVLNPVFYGVGSVVTPGNVAVTAEAPGRRAFRGDVAVTAGQTANVSLELPVVEVAATPAAAVTPAASAPAQSAGGGGSVAGPVVVLGVGVVGFVLGGVFGALRGESVAALSAQCAAPAADGLRYCDDSDANRGLLSSATNYSIAASVGIAVGVAGVAAGGVWLIATLVQRGKRGSGSERAFVVPHVDALGAGAAVGVRF